MSVYDESLFTMSVYDESLFTMSVYDEYPQQTQHSHLSFSSTKLFK